MFRRSAFAGLAIVFATTLAVTDCHAASCVICDTNIWLNDVTKDCFLDNVDKYLDEMKSSQSSYVTVDFESCVDPSKRGLIELPKDAQVSRKLSFILDRDSLNCLYRLVSLRGDDFDPYVVFQLDKDCRK
jgi:hypothetical protein